MTAHWFPHLRRGFWEEGACRSESSSGTTKRSPSLFILGDDVSDKELEGCGRGGGGGRGMRMLLQKIWLSFLCASMWTHTQPLRNMHVCKTNAHAHPSTLSLSLLPSLLNTITVIYTQKKKQRLALFLHSLAGDPEAEPGEERDTAPISCPKPSALANEKRDRPIWFHCEQTTRLSWLRDS